MPLLKCVVCVCVYIHIHICVRDCACVNMYMYVCVCCVVCVLCVCLCACIHLCEVATRYYQIYVSLYNVFLVRTYLRASGEENNNFVFQV